MTDDGIRFDGRSLTQGPLGGAETAFAELAEALAASGHAVTVFNRCSEPVEHNGVTWIPLGSEPVPLSAELHIANRGHRLLDLVPLARRTAFWIHNPARYLLKWRYQMRLLRRRPVLVFTSRYHAATYPSWAIGRDRTVIPLGLSALFRQARPRREAPPPRAVFTSNPLRGLDWLLEVWSRHIHPRLPAAELHVFAGAAIYGEAGAAKAPAMNPVLERARAMAGQGVVLRGPLPKPELARELSQARLFLYRGDLNETFCCAAAEAQAMGLPAVTENLGCLAERIRDGETGVIANGPEAFAEAACRLLADDDLWLSRHRACLEHQRGLGWDGIAARFLQLAG